MGHSKNQACARIVLNRSFRLSAVSQSEISFQLKRERGPGIVMPPARSLLRAHARGQPPGKTLQPRCRHLRGAPRQFQARRTVPPVGHAHSARAPGARLHLEPAQAGPARAGGGSAGPGAAFADTHQPLLWRRTPDAACWRSSWALPRPGGSSSGTTKAPWACRKVAAPHGGRWSIRRPSRPS